MARPLNDYYARRAGHRGILREYLPPSPGAEQAIIWSGVNAQERFRAAADRFVPVVCGTCGERFLRERRLVKPERATYCSNRCATRRPR